jgi:hypothetical protein
MPHKVTKPRVGNQFDPITVWNFSAEETNMRGIDTMQWIDWYYIGVPPLRAIEHAARIDLTQMKPATREVQLVHVCTIWKCGTSQTFSIREVIVDSCEVAKFYD